MHEHVRLRERDSELFRLVNTLKTKKIVYQKEKPDLYRELVSRRGEIDRELEADDCYMKTVPDKGMVMLSFYPDDTDYTNGLRKKFSLNEMKFYIVLLQIYSERYVSEGDYVTTAAEDFMRTWDDLGFTTKTNAATKRFLAPFIKTMKQYGMLLEIAEDSYVIQPGILFALDMTSFFEYYDGVLTPWFAAQREKDPEEQSEEA